MHSLGREQIISASSLILQIRKWRPRRDTQLKVTFDYAGTILLFSSRKKYI